MMVGFCFLQLVCLNLLLLNLHVLLHPVYSSFAPSTSLSALYPPTDSSWLRRSSSPILSASQPWEGITSGSSFRIYGVKTKRNRNRLSQATRVSVKT